MHIQSRVAVLLATFLFLATGTACATRMPAYPNAASPSATDTIDPTAPPSPTDAASPSVTPTPAMSPEPTPLPSPASVAPIAPAESPQPTTRPLTVAKRTANGFSYPVVKGGRADAALNKAIATFAKSTYRSADDLLDARYTVMRNDGLVFSVAFDGTTYTPGAAHPYHIYEPVSFDVTTARRIRLGDYAVIDTRFLTAFKAGFVEALHGDRDLTELDMACANCSTDAGLKKELEHADGDSGMRSCLTPDGVQVTVPAATVWDDHLEIRVNNADITLR